MSYILFKDISYAQGVYDMASNPDPAVMMKMSGAFTVSKGLYYDSQAARNYQQAIIHGKVPLMYHFAGGGDPVAEADWFVKAVSPLAENDCLCLDWEIEHSDPVGWCRTFRDEVFNKTGVYVWLYVDIDRLNRFDWSSVLNKSGLWCAAPSYSFDASLLVKYTVIAQQGPIVNGVDTDAFFGTIDQLKAYGYHAPVAPAPAPPPPPPPAPIQDVTPPPQPDTPPPSPEPIVINPTPVEPTPEPGQGTPHPTPDVTPVTPAQSWISKIINLLKRIFGVQ